MSQASVVLLAIQTKVAAGLHCLGSAAASLAQRLPLLPCHTGALNVPSEPPMRLLAAVVLKLACRKYVLLNSINSDKQRSTPAVGVTAVAKGCYWLTSMCG